MQLKTHFTVLHSLNSEIKFQYHNYTKYFLKNKNLIEKILGLTKTLGIGKDFDKIHCI